MNLPQRILAAILVLGLLVWGGVWFWRNTVWEERSIPPQLRGPALTDPFYGAGKVVQALGARSQWRHDLLELPPRNGIVLTGQWTFAGSGIMQSPWILEHWVESGGRLVIDLSLVEEEKELKRWAGLSRVAISPSDIDRAAYREDHWRLHSEGDGDAREYQVCCFNGYAQLHSERTPVWRLLDTANHLLGVRVRIGKGSVTYFNGRPFDTDSLLEDSQVQLLVDALALQRGDTVYFLSDNHGPTLLSLIWVHGWPVVLLLGLLLALALWRAYPRFGPLEASPARSRRSLGEQIRGTGRFTLRYGGEHTLLAAGTRALRDVVQRQIRGYDRLQPIDQARAVARLTGLPEEPLARALEPEPAPRRPDLYRSLRVLETARRKLLGAFTRSTTHAD